MGLLSKKSLNIVFLGGRRVGKTSLLSQWSQGEFSTAYYPTIGNIVRKEVLHGGRTYECKVTDTPGHDLYSPLSDYHVIGTHVFVLVYSFDDGGSLELVSALYGKILEFAGSLRHVLVIMAGNKADDTRRQELLYPEADRLAQKLGCPHLVVSSYWRESIDELFEKCITGGKPRSIDYSAAPETGRIAVPLEPNNLHHHNQPDPEPLGNEELHDIQTPTAHVSTSPSDDSRTARSSMGDESIAVPELGPRLSDTLYKEEVPGIYQKRRSFSPVAPVKYNGVTKDDVVHNKSRFIEQLTRIPQMRSVDEEFAQDFAGLFHSVVEDKVALRALREFCGNDAQVVLNALQWVLDSRKTGPSDKGVLLQLLLRLSKHFVSYPPCLELKEIKRLDDYPVTAGHFGDIWRGQYQGHKVCLKVVKVYERSGIDHFLRIFSREAVIWSHLKHDNVLPFYGIYELDESRRIALVSPWMENGTLREYLRNNPLTEVHRLLAVDVIRGLSYLHQQEMVHGDLKGDNVLIDSSGRACIADFGLSSLVDSELLRWTSSESRGAGGTARWQAPERFNESDDSSRPTRYSDIYSLGCVFYEIFTGNIPFHETKTEATVIFLVISGKKPPRLVNSDVLHRMEDDLKETLWSTMEQCWSPDPLGRPSLDGILSLKVFEDAVRNDQRSNGLFDSSLSASEFRHAIRFDDND